MRDLGAFQIIEQYLAGRILLILASWIFFLFY